MTKTSCRPEGAGNVTFFLCLTRGERMEKANAGWIYATEKRIRPRRGRRPSLRVFATDPSRMPPAMNADPDFNEDQKRYLQGFVSGVAAKRAALGMLALFNGGAGNAQPSAGPAANVPESAHRAGR